MARPAGRTCCHLHQLQKQLGQHINNINVGRKSFVHLGADCRSLNTHHAPQQVAVPSFFRAHVKDSPADTWTTSASPGGTLDWPTWFTPAARHALALQPRSAGSNRSTGNWHCTPCIQPTPNHTCTGNCAIAPQGACMSVADRHTAEVFRAGWVDRC